METIVKEDEGKVSYLVVITTKPFGCNDLDFSEDEYFAFRAGDGDAYQKALNCYNSKLEDEETVIATIAKVIKSTDY